MSFRDQYGTLQSLTPVVEDRLGPGHLAHEPADLPLDAPVAHVVGVTYRTPHGVFARCQCSWFFEVVEGDETCPMGRLFAGYLQGQRNLKVALVEEIARLSEQQRRDRDEWATASQLGMRG